MKKVIISLAFILITSMSFAQKSVVKRAYNKVKVENPNLKDAKNILAPALTNEESKNWNKTWYTAGLIQYKFFDTEWRKKAQKAKYNKDLMYNSLGLCYDYLLKCHELDIQPDKKGRVKPKYSKKIVELLKTCRNFFIEAGNYYLVEKKNSKMAYKYFMNYTNYLNLDILSEQDYKKDTLYNSVLMYAGYAAYNAKMHKEAIVSMEVVKNTPLNEKDQKLPYQILMMEYQAVKDQTKYNALLEEAADKFPTELQFLQELINIKLLKNDGPSAEKYLDLALKTDSTIASLWELKGTLTEQAGDTLNALKFYKKAIALKPDMITAYKNVGRVYFNLAAKEQEEAKGVKDVKKYNAQMAKANPYFEKCVPYFEKVRKAEPENIQIASALRTIYYNLKEEAKYKELNDFLEKKD